MLLIAETGNNISFIDVYVQSWQQTPIRFWGFLLPFNLLINLTWIGLLFVKSKRANIGLLSFQIFLFTSVYWSARAIGDFLARTLQHEQDHGHNRRFGRARRRVRAAIVGEGPSLGAGGAAQGAAGRARRRARQCPCGGDRSQPFGRGCADDGGSRQTWRNGRPADQQCGIGLAGRFAELEGLRQREMFDWIAER